MNNDYFGNRIVVTGDSTALPREEVGYEDTYVYLLKKNLPNYDVLNFSVRSNTMVELYTFKDYYYTFIKPKIVIIHVGIVDSYPRPYPQSNIFRFIKAKIDRYLFNVDDCLKKAGLFYLFSDLFNFKTVKLEVFKQKVKEIIQEIDAEKIIVIGIIKASKVLARSKIADREFQKYNDCLASQLRDGIEFIDMSDVSADHVLWDGYHLSKEGHEYLAHKLIKIVNSVSDNGYEKG